MDRVKIIMPLATMPFIGRLGNILFQYAWLRAWAEQNGYEVQSHPWLGEKVFSGVPRAVGMEYKSDKVFPEDYCQRQECLIYTRKQAKEWFRFKDDVLERLQPARCKTEVVLNTRQANDYIAADMVCIDSMSYLNALCNFFGADKAFEWESDLAPTRLTEFDGSESASGLGTTEVCLPSFYRLMTAPILFRTNSTFSWWAATLGDGRVFSPVIEGMKGGIPNQYCDNWVEGNWPRMSLVDGFTDLHLKES